MLPRELLHAGTNGPGLALSPGLALICSPDAVVTRIVYDGVGLGEQLSEGMAFTSLFGPRNVQRCREFLQAIRNCQRVDNWRMSISVKGRNIPLSFCAAERGGKLELIGALTAAGAEQIRNTFYDLRHSYSPAAAPPDRTAPARTARYQDTHATPGELVERIAALEQLNEEKIRWILAATHDLVNKVNTVQACAEILADDGDFEPNQRITLESIQACSDEMARLLQNLEQIARSESKEPWLELADSALLAVIERSIALSLPEAAKKGIRIDLTCSGEPPLLRIDALKVVHGFANLLFNSIHYCEAGADIQVRIFSHNAKALVSVTDSGPGMPEEELREMFTPFHRSRKRPVSAEAGTSLGLAICKRVVEAHGGDIWAESKPGDGNVIYVVLPLLPCQYKEGGYGSWTDADYKSICRCATR
jgi:signal transduction histidine kinase